MPAKNDQLEKTQFDVMCFTNVNRLFKFSITL